jgi:hypothetical protein
VSRAGIVASVTVFTVSGAAPAVSEAADVESWAASLATPDISRTPVSAPAL